MVGELDGSGILRVLTAFQQQEQRLVVDPAQLAFQGPIAAELMEGFQELLLAAVLVPGHVQGQHGQERPGESHIVGSLHVRGHIGEKVTLEKLKVSGPVPRGHAVHKLRDHIPELFGIAGGHCVGHGVQVPEDIAFDMAGGIEVHVSLEELQNIVPDAV